MPGCQRIQLGPSRGDDTLSLIYAGWAQGRPKALVGPALPRPLLRTLRGQYGEEKINILFLSTLLWSASVFYLLAEGTTEDSIKLVHLLLGRRLGPGFSLPHVGY